MWKQNFPCPLEFPNQIYNLTQLPLAIAFGSIVLRPGVLRPGLQPSVVLGASSPRRGSATGIGRR